MTASPRWRRMLARAGGTVIAAQLLVSLSGGLRAAGAAEPSPPPAVRPGTGPGAPAEAGGLSERGGLAEDLRRLAADERQALAQLLDLQLQVRQIDGRLADLGREIDRRHARLAELGREEERLVARLARVRDLAARRLRLLYERGQLGYLDVLLGAATFQDFLSRLGVIRDLVAYDQRVLSELKRLRADVARGRLEAAAERDALAADQRRLAEERDRRAVAAQDLERRLAALRGDRARFEARLAELDRVWAAAFPDLREMVDALLQLSPDLKELDPRVEVQFAPLRARVEIAEAALDRYLRGKGVDRLRLGFVEGGLVVTGEPAVPLRVEGTIEPDGAGLRVDVRAVTLHGIPVDRAAWAELLGRQRIVLQPIAAPVAYRVTEVRSVPGRLTIALEAG